MALERSKVFIRILQKVTVLLVFLVIFGGLAWMGWQVYQNVYGEVKETIVPSFINQSETEAGITAKTINLRIKVEKRVYHNVVKKDYVISQDPAPGKKVKAGRIIYLIVSDGLGKVVIPELVKKPLREAQVILANNRLAVGKILYGYSNEVLQETIMTQDPASGLTVPLGTEVNLTISKGPEKLVTVPDLVGKDIADAKNLLEENKLRKGLVIWVPRPHIEKGKIISQSPPANNEVKQKDMVSLEVSAGIEFRASAYKQGLLEITVPPSAEKQSVKIVVTDKTGANTVYFAKHNGGNVITLQINSMGDATIEVFVNNILSNKTTI